MTEETTTEYRIMGRQNDGGEMTHEGTDEAELRAMLEEDGYEIARVETRQVTEWERVA